MKRNKYLILIGGPTAVGKTTTSIELANQLDCDIISADSRQFYREMNIGTAKPTPSELAQAKHHFINSLSIDQGYSVGQFEDDTLSLLDDLFSVQDYCILTGGSGLYLNAISQGLDKFPEVAPSFRQALNLEAKQNGLPALVEELKAKDPNYYAIVDQQNPQRIIRALEVIRSTQQPFSSFLRHEPVERPFHILPFKIEMERSTLYDRINRRVDMMVEQGLEAEARSLHPKQQLNSLRTVGYSEWFRHFDGEITSERAVELIKRNTRRYAKRQTTWFRNQGAFQAIQQGDQAVKQLLKSIEEFKKK